MIAIRIPQEFYDFCIYLHQDSVEVYGDTVEKVIAGALQHMDIKGRFALKKFIGELLTRGYSDAELLEIYKSTDAELGIHGDKGLRNFLAMVRDLVEHNT